MEGLMTNLVVAGIGIGVISMILGIIAKFTGGLWTLGALAYLRFAQTSFLGAISVGVLAVLRRYRQTYLLVEANSKIPSHRKDIGLRLFLRETRTPYPGQLT